MKLFKKASVSKTNPDRYFQTDSLKGNLKSQTLRGGIITVITQVLRMFLGIGSTILLARLLSPQDFGLTSMVGSVVNFLSIFRELGLSRATVQKAEINHAQVSTLFWINTAFGLAIALITACLAPVLAWFYHEPRLTSITLVLSVGFFLSGLGVQHKALLARQMRMGALARIQIISSLTSLLVGTSLALYGFGYWALVWMQVAMGVIDLVGSWILCGWVPGLPVRNSGVRSMLAFGSNLTGFQILNYFSRNLDNILIGRYLGADQLGIYAKAYQLLLLPLQQVSLPLARVAGPTLSRLQDDPERYRAYYRMGILLVVTLGMPLVGFTFAAADKVILVLMGQQWLAVVPIYQLLAPAAFLGTFNSAIGWVYDSLGRTDRQLRWGFLTSGVTVVGFFIGIQWGMVGVATAYSLTTLLLRIPSILYCYQGTPLQLRELANTLLIPTVASLGAAAALMGANQLLPKDLYLGIAFLLNVVLYGLFYLGLWLIFPQGKTTLIEVFKLAKDIRKKPKGRSTPK